LATPAGKEVKLHQYFHHLNSSQAMAFNLFFPFLGLPDADPAALLDAMKLPAGRLERWAFESVPDQGEGTNFDLHLFVEGGAQYFVEVKLSEQEFGMAKRDARHRRKLVRIYRPRLVGKANHAALVEEPFFKHYQLLRNLSHLQLDRGDRLVVLVPRASDSLVAGREFLLGAVTPPAAQAVAFVYLEDIIERLTRDGHLSPRLTAHIELFTEKYVL